MAYVVQRLSYTLSHGGDSLSDTLVNTPMPLWLRGMGGFDEEDHDSMYRDLLLQAAFRYAYCRRFFLFMCTDVFLVMREGISILGNELPLLPMAHKTVDCTLPPFH